jgi:hypothetical protein
VLDHQWFGDSPGVGIMRRRGPKRRRRGRRPAGAVKAPYDWPATTRSCRLPTASMTASAWSVRVANSSSAREVGGRPCHRRAGAGDRSSPFDIPPDVLEQAEYSWAIPQLAPRQGWPLVSGMCPPSRRRYLSCRGLELRGVLPTDSAVTSRHEPRRAAVGDSSAGR